VLAERNELAGEIHDSLGQFFTGISMQLGAAMEVMKAGGGSVLSYVERAFDPAQFGLGEARRSAFSLQPKIIEESGLIEALQKMIERSNIPGRLRCTWEGSRHHDRCSRTDEFLDLPKPVRADPPCLTNGHLRAHSVGDDPRVNPISAII
jgi:signal transduction histidine kinase